MKGRTFKNIASNGRVTWRYMIDAGRDEKGKRIRVSESGFRLEREAVDALREKITELKGGGGIATSAALKEYIDRWLPYHTKAKSLAPKTAERYVSLAAHITRALGQVRLKDVTTFMLDDLYVKLAENLSAKTVREVHSVAHVALKRAVKTKLIPFNPADSCDLPRLDPKEAVAISPEQLAAYEEAARGTWVDLLIRLAADTGARRGELLATTWRDLNWNTSEIRTERALFQVKGQIGVKSTKTRQNRVVSIPPSLIEYLKIHKEAQDQCRTLCGPDYRTDLDLIFADPAGNYLHPSSVTRAAVRLAKKAGITGVGLHTLRHTHASVLLHNGVALPVVSKRLGHRDPYTTARIYAHALPDTDRDVALTWDKLTQKKAEENPVAQNGTNTVPRGTIRH
jgi:integrase